MTPELEKRIIDMLEVAQTRISKSLESTGKDGWDRARVIAGWIAAIAVPLVVAVVGWYVNSAIQSQDSRTELTKLAIEILRTEPRENEDDRRIRGWAADLIDTYSEVKLPPGTRESLTKTSLPQAEGVVGRDDRSDVPVRVRPWNSVCKLILEHGDVKGRYASGFFVSKNVIVTTRHFLQLRAGESPIRVESPLIEGGVARAYIVKVAENKDLALVILPPEIRLTDEPAYRLVAIDPASLRDQHISVAGFPIDRLGLIQTRGNVTSVQGGVLHHDMDTGAGVGGGPVWIDHAGEFQVIAVHIGGGAEGKQATLITDDLRAFAQSATSANQ